MTLVLIDVDGTLIEGTHSEPLFIRYLLIRGVLGPRQLTSFASFIPRYAARFGRHVLKKDKAYLNGLTAGAVQAAAEEFVDTVLLGLVHRPLQRRLDQHRRSGDTLALLTGTPDFIARPLAERLSVPYMAATVCDQSDGVFTVRPPRYHPFGFAKVEAAEDLCRRLDIPLSTCVAYGDSIHDLALLERVRRAVAVAPDRALREEAQRWHWEILSA